MRRPSPALVLSCVAVFLSAAGGAVAAGQINGKQIKDGSITGKDIKKQGPAATGAPFAGGGVAVSYRHNTQQIPADSSQFVYALCPAGQVPTGGSYAAAEELAIQRSGFGDSTSGNPDSWRVIVDNPTGDAHPITVEVSCVTPSSVSPF